MIIVAANEYDRLAEAILTHDQAAYDIALSELRAIEAQARFEQWRLREGI